MNEMMIENKHQTSVLWYILEIDISVKTENNLFYSVKSYI